MPERPIRESKHETLDSLFEAKNAHGEQKTFARGQATRGEKRAGWKPGLTEGNEGEIPHRVGREGFRRMERAGTRPGPTEG